MAKKGPEHELVRIPTLEKLVEAGWRREQIVCPEEGTDEKEWRVPKTPHDATEREKDRRFDGFPVDIAIFDSAEQAGKHEHLYGIVECKRPDVDAGVSQLEIYMGLEPQCRFGLWTNGKATAMVYKLADGTFGVERNAGIPKPGDNLRRAGKERVKETHRLKPLRGF